MITAVSMVKNSADVIETMVRGNSLVADNFVVINNASTDNTVEILSKLRGEGFSIDILDDMNISPYQKARVNEAIRYALNKYHPDYILPVDDDEIICSDSGDIHPTDLKENIEGLDQGNLYYMNCRHFIPTDEDDPNQICVALRQKFCLDDEPDMTRKTLIPAGIASQDSFQIGWGSHFAESDNIQNHVLLNGVRLAHYPIRSSIQIASKAITGWINYLAMPDRAANLSIHWKQMYTVIKEYGLPTNDMMLMLANMYREHPGDSENLNVAYHPVNIPDDVLKLRYTSATEINLFKNILENFERIAVDYAQLLHEKQSTE